MADTSDEQQHADAWLDASRESSEAYSRSRRCEGCKQRVIYGRLTWDELYDARTGIGHMPDCPALAHWVILEAGGATTWDEDPGGGGGGSVPITWATTSITFADSDYTFASLTT